VAWVEYHRIVGLSQFSLVFDVLRNPDSCKLGLESVILRHLEDPYQSGPSKAWLKVKNSAPPGILRFEDQT
jgi:ATP-dependent DNA ligase